jgi:hypothetical protein
MHHSFLLILLLSKYILAAFYRNKDKRKINRKCKYNKFNNNRKEQQQTITMADDKPAAQEINDYQAYQFVVLFVSCMI